MKDPIFYNKRYVDLAISLAKATKQRSLYQKLIRIQKMMANLGPELEAMAYAIADAAQNQGRLAHEIFPELQEFNLLETQLVSQALGAQAGRAIEKKIVDVVRDQK